MDEPEVIEIDDDDDAEENDEEVENSVDELESDEVEEPEDDEGDDDYEDDDGYEEDTLDSIVETNGDASLLSASAPRFLQRSPGATFQASFQCLIAQLTNAPLLS